MNEQLLGDDQIERYSRQLNLKRIGVEGQRRLLDSGVLCVGAGGLGCPAALYLAAAGVGTLGIVDGDRVELSNLHRQILHTVDDIGRPKSRSARDALQRLNPDVQVIPYPEYLDAGNALEILSGYDVVVNGCDNFATRYLVNDACVLHRIPLVDASVLRWEARCTVYSPGNGCYRCLYPDPPPEGSVPSCAEAGVTGALAGHVGTRQALEALKLILGIGRTLANRQLIFDALSGDYRELSWERDRSCPVCGDAPVITSPGDLRTGSSCGAAGGGSSSGDYSNEPYDTRELCIEPDAAAELLGEAERAVFVDVRAPDEFRRAHIPGSMLVPMPLLSEALGEVDRRREIVLVCHRGVTSTRAAIELQKAGFGRARSLSGGMIDWLNRRYPVESD